MSKEEAEKVVAEFMKATPTWLGSLVHWEELRGQGCKMCGAKYDSIKKLYEALRLLHPTL